MQINAISNNRGSTVEEPLVQENRATVKSLDPVQPKRRVVEIDILRGFALLGVVLVNFRSVMMGNFTYSSDGGLDYAVYWVIDTFFKTETYPLFSLLFGLGVAIQMLRLEAKEATFLPIYLRRLFILFLIGVIHSLFIWEPDFLQLYAVAGLMLIPFRHLSLRALLSVAGVTLAISVLTVPVWRALPELYSLAINPNRAPVPVAAAESSGSNLEKAGQPLYLTASYLDIVQARIESYIQKHTFSKETLYRFIDELDILSLFLVGLYVGRRGIWQNLRRNRRFFWRIMVLTLLLGGLAAGWTWIWSNLGRLVTLDSVWTARLFHHLTGTTMTAIVSEAYGPILALTYACALVLLLQNDRWLDWLTPLAALGRLSLTSYLLISLIGTTLFYGYGLGLYGQLGFAQGTVLALAVYILLIVGSGWWLKQFRFGPMEWVWRSLTYNAFLPMRQSSNEN